MRPIVLEALSGPGTAVQRADRHDCQLSARLSRSSPSSAGRRRSAAALSAPRPSGALRPAQPSEARGTPSRHRCTWGRSCRADAPEADYDAGTGPGRGATDRSRTPNRSGPTSRHRTPRPPTPRHMTRSLNGRNPMSRRLAVAVAAAGLIAAAAGCSSSSASPAATATAAAAAAAASTSPATPAGRGADLQAAVRRLETGPPARSARSSPRH
jgi:hypothetical protein